MKLFNPKKWLEQRKVIEAENLQLRQALASSLRFNETLVATVNAQGEIVRATKDFMDLLCTRSPKGGLAITLDAKGDRELTETLRHRIWDIKFKIYGGDPPPPYVSDRKPH